MKKMSSFLAVLLAAVLMVTSVPSQAAAGEENLAEAEETVQLSGMDSEEAAESVESAGEPGEEPDQKETGSDSGTAPENYVPQKSEEKISPAARKARAGENEETKKVLLIQDTEPWDSDANEVVLNTLGYDYDLVGTQNFLRVDLTQYGVVIFANDQAFNAYENYKEFREYLELFAELGGVIVFGASDYGWADGSLTEELPGGVSKSHAYEYRNRVADQDHPIVTGELTDAQILTDDDLYSNYCSHTYFNEESFPVGTDIILEDTDGHPTLIEYPVGHGRIIASGLTWEHNYYHGGGTYGEFAKKSMDDMFAYAVRVSAIGIEDLTPLKNYWNNKNQHVIGVAKREDQTPIQDAVIKIDGKEYRTDEDGLAAIPDFANEKKMVTVEADGYRTQSFEYTLERTKTRFFYLENQKDNLPYFTMIEEADRYYDLMTEGCYFDAGSDSGCRIKIGADWAGHGEGSYQLMQVDNANGICKKVMEITDSELTISPGRLFDPETDIYMTAVAADGTRSEEVRLQIHVYDQHQDEQTEDMLESDSFQIMKSGKGSLNDSDYTSFFPDNYSVSSTLLPVHVEKKTNEGEGTYEINVYIGVSYDQLKDKNVFAKADKTLKSAVSSVDRLDRLADAMTAFGAVGGSYSIAGCWESDFEGGGYYTATYDMENNKISDAGGLYLKAKGEKTIWGSQFLAGPVPIYCSVKGGISANLVQGLKFEDKWSYDGTMKISPFMKMSGGLGIKGVASVGGGGKGALDLTIQPEGKLDLTLNAFLEASLFLVFDWEFSSPEKTFAIYPQSKAARSLSGTEEGQETGSLKKMDMGFAGQTSSWYPERLSRSAAGPVMLQDSVLPSMTPAVIQTENGAVAVFQSASSEEDAVNSLSMNYSVYENGVWSEPQKLSEDGKAALYADLTTVDGRVFAVWQQCSEAIPEGEASEQVQAILTETELYAAEFDPESRQFKEAVCLTNNEKMELQPTFVKNAETPSVIWAEMDGEELFGEENRYLIKQSVFEDGKWSKGEEIGCTEKTVVSLDAGYEDGCLYTVYVGAESDNSSDPEVYLLESGEELAITEDEFVQDNVQIAGGKMLYLTEDGMESYDLKSGEREVVSSLESASSSFKTAGRDRLVWNDGDTVYVSKLQEEGWTKPVKLYETQDFSIKYAGYFDTGDGWNLLLVTEDSEQVTALQSLTGSYGPAAEMKLLLADEKERKDGKQPITFSVENTGGIDLSGLTYTLKDGGQVEASTASEDVLGIGEKTVKTETFAITEPETLKTYILELSTADGAVLAEQEVVLGRTDLQMEVRKKDLGDKILLEVQIFNQSATPSDAAFTIQDGVEEGMILYIEHMTQITQDESYTYLYTFDKDKIAYDENGLKYYSLQVESGVEDSDMTNNELIVVLKQEPEELPDLILPDDVPADTYIPVTGISVKQNMIELKEGETKQIEASVIPSNATTQGIEYESSDYSVVLVNGEGVITAQGEGEAVITARTVDGAYVQEIAVTVENTSSEEPGGTENPSDPEEPLDPDKTENPDTSGPSDGAEDQNNPQNSNDGNQSNKTDAAAKTGDCGSYLPAAAAIILAAGTAAVCFSVKRKRRWYE